MNRYFFLAFMLVASFITPAMGTVSTGKIVKPFHAFQMPGVETKWEVFPFPLPTNELSLFLRDCYFCDWKCKHALGMMCLVYINPLTGYSVEVYYYRGSESTPKLLGYAWHIETTPNQDKWRFWIYDGEMFQEVDAQNAEYFMRSLTLIKVPQGK